MKLITTIYKRDREFYILKDNNGFWGIESKHFENGKLTIQMNGLAGNLHKTREETIKAVMNKIEYEHLVENGMDEMEALMRVYAM